MRVMIDVTSIGGNITGVGRHTTELLRCLREQQGVGDRIFAYPPSWMRKLRSRWRKISVPEPSSLPVKRMGKLPSVRKLATSMLRPFGHALLSAYDWSALNMNRFDIYHEPNFIPIDCDIPTATTFHDLSSIRHPEWHPQSRMAFIEEHLDRALRQSIHFFTVSEFVRREMMDFFNIPAHKITCAHNGVRRDMRPMERKQYQPILRRLGLPENYLLHVGTIEPRKNLLRLMRAYIDLPADLRAKHPLALVGQWGWCFEETAEYYHSIAKHKGVMQIGYVDDADLPAVYNGARALLMPTYYEGFGIPAVEMMGCGGAVLASTAGAVAEVVGSDAELIDPEDTAGWRDAMLDILTDDDWWIVQRRGAVERARHFSWDRTAAITLGVYRRLVGEETMAPGHHRQRPIPIPSHQTANLTSKTW